MKPRGERLPKKDIKERVHELLEVVQLTQNEHRYSEQLSGGQKQRVALAHTHLLSTIWDAALAASFFIKISLGTLTYNFEYYNIFTKVTKMNIFKNKWLRSLYKRFYSKMFFLFVTFVHIYIK
ncbi:hypothetical protein ACSLGF_08080 [Bacillus sp. A015]|uniref:hypothetical protein n=1 Tax=Bacillus TaxID=1386 RepID=UPI003531A4C5